MTMKQELLMITTGIVLGMVAFYGIKELYDYIWYLEALKMKKAFLDAIGTL